MSSRTNRREFLRRTGLAGAGFWVFTREGWAQQPKSPNEKLNVGVIGVGGRGEANLNAIAGENVVALCDVDDKALAKAAARFSKAEKFHDFRKLLERKEVEAVTVSTADHCHAAAANMAMKLGKHVYCEKPLTHSIYEARVLAQTAAKMKIATQMGNQGHSNDGARRTVELIRSGAIGPIREAHCWTDRPGRFWFQGIDRPTETPAVPSDLHWDLWLGPAPERPYHPAYHPFKWRGWWDFGTGAIGDMACHVMDVAYWALDLRDPATIEAEGPPPNQETGPTWMIVSYQFPARGERPPRTLMWYEAGKKPAAELFEGEKVEDNGTLFIGEKGKIYFPDPYGARSMLLPKAQFAGFKPPEPSIPNSIGHHAEWIRACKGGEPAGSHFGYAGPLTEMALLGNVAYRAGKPIRWNAERMRCPGTPEAERFIRRDYRKGWEL